MQDIQHVFIIGAKGIPGSYGGYETFVDKLTECHENVNLYDLFFISGATPRPLALQATWYFIRFTFS